MHITEDLSVAVRSHVQAVNWFNACVFRDRRRCWCGGINCLFVLMSFDFSEIYWSSYSKS